MMKSLNFVYEAQEVFAQVCLELGCSIDEIMEIFLKKREKEDMIWI